MSSIAAVLPLETARVDPAHAPRALRSMLAAMPSRGADTCEVSAVLGVARHRWELPLTERTGVVARGRATIAADASLTYRNELRALLASHGASCARGAGSAELILGAYEAFGVECVRHLEGDFAFVIWDEMRQQLFAARGFNGRRTLFHARGGGMLVIASTVRALLTEPAVSREISMTTVTSIAAGLWSHSDETGYRAITELSAGHRLIAPLGGPVTIERFWHPVATLVSTRESVADASEQLRELLVRAVDERLDPAGPTAVSLSGGWDSSAVFGAGQVALERSATGRSLRPVSISYPVGDVGREDEIIQEIVGHWRTTTEWLTVDDIPMFVDPEASAASRDEPFSHAFEHWNRQLARGARRVGARVILDGSGGDQLFQVSDIYLADIFRSGHWVELWSQWRARGGNGWKQLYRTAIRPTLPEWLTRGIATVRHTSPPAHYLDRQPPHWFRRSFLSKHSVIEREQSSRPTLSKSSHVLAEAQAYLLFPYCSRIMRMVGGFGLEEGVEARSPLLDDRVVKFAMQRPWHERADRKETKLALRGAMRGVLPDGVLAPRETRTGTVSDYFSRQLRGPGRSHIESMLRDSFLAKVGMVEPGRLQRAWESFLTNDSNELGAKIFLTLQADLWLRARMS